MRENLAADIHLITDKRGFQRELVGSCCTYERFGKWEGMVIKMKHGTGVVQGCCAEKVHVDYQYYHTASSRPNSFKLQEEATCVNCSLTIDPSALATNI